MTPIIQLKKGQLRIRWPFVKHATWEKICADLGKQRQHSEYLKRKVEDQQREIAELKKAVASRIVFHVGNPDVIRITNERGVEDSSLTDYVLQSPDTQGGLMFSENDEYRVVRGELVCYAHTAPRGELLALPEFTIRRMAQVLVDEIIKRWKQNGKARTEVR